MAGLNIDNIPQIISAPTKLTKEIKGSFDSKAVHHHQYGEKALPAGGITFLKKIKTEWHGQWNSLLNNTVFHAKGFGWKENELCDLIKNHAPQGLTKGDKATIKSVFKSKKKKPDTTQASIYTEIVLSDKRISLIKNNLQQGYMKNDNFKNGLCLKIKSSEFKSYISQYIKKKTGKLPQRKTIDEVVYHLDSHAIYNGKEKNIDIRVGLYSGDIYIATYNLTKPFIKLTKEGASFVNSSPLYFYKPKSHDVLTIPDFFDWETPGEKFNKLFQFIPMYKKGERLLLASYCVAVIMPGIGTRPVGVVSGEHGSGKSTACRLLKMLLDPDVIGIRSLPQNEREFAIACQRANLLAFDNISHISDNMSDVLCKAASGTTFTTRSLYSDDEETILSFKRAILLNGITANPEKSDLQDRSILFHMETPTQRLDESDIIKEFKKHAPDILAGLLELTSVVLREIDDTRNDDNFRLSGFAKIGKILEREFEYKENTFRTAYLDNRRKMSIQIMEKEAVIKALIQKYKPLQKIDLPAARLFALLKPLGGHFKSFPQSGGGLGKKLSRLAPTMREFSFEVSFSKDAKGRSWTIRMPPKNSILWDLFPEEDHFAED